MADKKDIKNAQALKDEYLGAKNYAKDLLSSMEGVGKRTRDTYKFAKDLSDSMMGQLDTSAKLNTLVAKRADYIKDQIKRGAHVNKTLMSQVDSQIKVLQLKQEQEEKDKVIAAEAVKQAEYEKGLLDDRKKTLNNILGLNDDISKAVARGGIAALAMNKAFENVGTALTSHLNAMKDMVTQQGLSVKEAITLKGSVDAASFSMTGLLYGSDQLALSAAAIAEKFGNVNAATGEMIKSVTEVAALTGDAASATDLVTTFQNAGMEAGDVGDHIKELAEKHGVNAKKMMEGMTSQMSKLRGKTQEQLDVILEGNAALIKQGTNMEEIQNIANNVLDIEGNMKAAAKARVMLGRDVNANAVRSAALALESARSDEERAEAQKRIAEEILKGVGGQAAQSL